jgi:hypothetical protein
MVDTATLDRLAGLKTALAKRPLRPEARHALEDDGRRWPKRVADCERKKSFANRMDAESRLRRLRQNIEAGIRPTLATMPLAVYRCRVCSLWHLTGVPQ